ncbi:MMPL family transporter [Salegentibacter sp. BLCTC]|uniref:MMPL family transporter n=1 Tax=Salegentibacter sp. BLCTC TaxID=2697368 RepID=UPI00187B2D41|nr:MMPL family transporter [Salegentibacter sp. BLCTC]MBE7638791.1 MMPL family transporter [Salegentibacter sp. BLCTC]
MHTFFLKLYYFFRRQKAVGFFLLALFVGVNGYFASKITLEEDVTKLIPTGEKQDVLREVLEHTEFSDKLIIAVSSEEKDPEELTRYANQLTDSLHSQIPGYFTKIQGKVPEAGVLEVYDFVYQNLPLFLNEKNYAEIENRLEVDSIQDRLEKSYKNLISPTGFVTKNFIFKDPLSITNLGLEKLRELQVDTNFKIYNNYLITKNEQHLLLFITPKYPSSETKNNQIFIQELDKIISNLNKNPKVNAQYFGGVLYAIANANQIKKDIQITLSIAFSILFLLLIVFYRKFYVPLLLFIPSVLGALLAIGVLYLTKSSVSAISLGIGAILLGISLDYALHILTHFRNNANVKVLYKEVAKPILMSSFTTAIAFLCLLFLKSEALNDLGIFAAVSVVTASVFALLLIPHFYRAPKDPKKIRSNWLDKIASYRFYERKFFVAGVVLLFIGGLFFFNSVRFNEDLSQLNYEPKNIKEVEENIKNISKKAANTTYLVSYGKDIEEALEQNNELYRELQLLKNTNKIENFSSIGGVVLSTQSQNEKIETWRDFWTKTKKEKLKENLLKESAKLGFKQESFNRFYEQLDKDFSGIFLDDYRNVKTLYLDDFINRSPGFSTVTSTLSFNEMQSGVLEQLEKKGNVIAIDRKQMNQDFLGNLKNEFNRLILFSVIAVFIVLLFFYRSLLLSLLTLLPIAVTWVIALGLMAIFEIQFNVLNIIISTFIFGLGLDYSIFITNACLKEYETGKKALATYQASILLSVLTTLLGIGALIFAKHPALQSVSIVSVIGIITAMIVAFVFQTKLFQILLFKRRENGRAALGFRAFFKRNTSKERLYFKQKLLANYRYKSVYKNAKNEFSKQRERFLITSEFVEPGEHVFLQNTYLGLLPLFLFLKNQHTFFQVFDSDKENLKISKNSFSASSENLKFQKNIPSQFTGISVFIITKNPEAIIAETLREAIKKNAEKVIILTSDYNSRWLIDHNFEIIYRQNNILILKRMS